jgi:hypothetical protein
MKYRMLFFRKIFHITYLSITVVVVHSCSTSPDIEKSLLPTASASLNHVKGMPAKHAQQDDTAALPPKYNYNVLIENSISMEGYINGLTDFGKATFNMISDLKISASKNKLNLFYINSEIIPLPTYTDSMQIPDFIRILEPNSFKLTKGNRANTELYDIISDAAKYTDASSVSMIVSDLIFSPGHHMDAQKYLVHQQVGLKTLFAEKIVARGLSTLILKFNSTFLGDYYDRENTPIDLNGKNAVRPFYMMFIGPDAAIREVLQMLDMEKYKQRGFDQFCYFSDIEHAGANKSRARSSYRGKIGEYEITDRGGSMTIVNAQKSEENNKFRFSIIADMSKLLVSSEYITDPKNYEVYPPGHTISIEPLLETYQGYTHLIKVAIPQLKNTEDSVSVRLKNISPNWIETTNSDDDKNIGNEPAEMHRTFGLKYLINGIDDAYKRSAENRYLFSANIHVSKAATGSSGILGWMVFAIMVAAITYFILILKRK